MKHLISIADLSREDIERICDRAAAFEEVQGRPVKKVPALRGRTVLNLFYESSTRTRSSFELAAKRLSADVVNFSASGSSVDKGESLKDTVLTLGAHKPDAIVIRTPWAGAAELVSRWTPAAIVNAGDGKHEHPTQAQHITRCLEHARAKGAERVEVKEDASDRFFAEMMRKRTDQVFWQDSCSLANSYYFSDDGDVPLRPALTMQVFRRAKTYPLDDYALN